MKPVVFVAVPLAPDLQAQLAERCEVLTFDGPYPIGAAALAAGLVSAEGVLANPLIPFPAEVLDAAPRLRAVANIGVGYDNVDLAAARARGIAVANTPDVLSDAVADCVMGMIIAVARKLPLCNQVVRDGRWGAAPLPLGSDLRDKTLALIGFGRIGREVAARALAFKMRVVYFDPRAGADDGGAVRMDTLEDALAPADVVSLHVDLNEGTRGFFGAREFGAMKRGALFVNAARGAVVDQDALCDALDSGHVGGAALDVLVREPPDPGERILTFENVYILPHIASGAVETRRAMAELAVRNIIACVHGEPCACIVRV